MLLINKMSIRNYNNKSKRFVALLTALHLIHVHAHLHAYTPVQTRPRIGPDTHSPLACCRRSSWRGWRSRRRARAPGRPRRRCGSSATAGSAGACRRRPAPRRRGAAAARGPTRTAAAAPAAPWPEPARCAASPCPCRSSQHTLYCQLRARQERSLTWTRCATVLPINGV